MVGCHGTSRHLQLPVGVTVLQRGGFYIPRKTGLLGLREAALLQTFPKNYKFSFSSGKQGVAMMIGNALPPTFIEFHANSLVKHLQLLDT